MSGLIRRAGVRSSRGGARAARARLVRAVLLVLTGAVLLSGCDFSVYSLPLPGGAKLGDDPIEVKVQFRDVLDLVPQSSVKVDDVAVGRVEKIDVQGYHALVTLKLRKSVKLPDNAVATIRQTSLLGEKFVSLAPPSSGSTGRLGNGDLITLANSGRNPEVEEVLGALSLLLNGGGVAQLKTISTELNKALGGRETDVRSLLTQLKTLTGQLDTNKAVIVRAIESLNRLSISLDKQKPAITSALDHLPRAVASINRQRDDLVKVLHALSRLSTIGTKVISQSKAATVDSLKALAPTLTKLAETGDALPKALQVFLTYPFVDAAVGTNPAQARSIHLGDYTNLSAQLDLDLSDLGIGQVCSLLPQLEQLGICDNPDLTACVTNLIGTDPTALNGQTVDELLTTLTQKCGGAVQKLICTTIKGVPGLPSALTDLCSQLGIPTLPIPLPSVSALTKCLTSGKPLGKACDALNPLTLVQRCAATTAKTKPSGYYSDACVAYRRLNLGIVKGGTLGKLPIVGSGSGSGSGSGGGGGILGGLGGLGGGGGGGGGLLGLNRSAPGSTARSGETGAASVPAARSDLAAMLVWGMMQR